MKKAAPLLVVLLVLPALFLLTRTGQPASVAQEITEEANGATEETVLPHVIRTIDGDTFDVLLADGTTERVRMLGIDTPETVHPSKPVQCFGKEASNRLKELLSDRDIELETNPAEDRDVFGRLLRYVRLDGEDINARMVSDGFAFSYRKYPQPRMEEYNRLELRAREEKRGLWGDICDYAE